MTLILPPLCFYIIISILREHHSALTALIPHELSTRNNKAHLNVFQNITVFYLLMANCLIIGVNETCLHISEEDTILLVSCQICLLGIKSHRLK